MKDLSLRQLFDFYVDTARWCTSDLPYSSQKEIEYNLLEQFAADVWTFFHDANLRKLHDEGLISNEAMSLSQEIRKLWLELEPTVQATSWSAAALATDQRWAVLFSRCGKLLSQLRADG